jgi:hypothetical protein
MKIGSLILFFLLIMAIIFTGCTRTDTKSQDASQTGTALTDNSGVTSTDDISTEITIDNPSDPGLLDDINVSDSMP